MKTYLLTWNPARFHWETLAEDAETVRRCGHDDGNWTCARTKSIRPGDRVFLMRQGVEPRGIMASGCVLTPPTPGTIGWDDTRLGETTNYIDVRFDAILDPAKEAVLTRATLEQGLLGEVNWDTQAGGMTIRADCAALLEEAWAAHLADLGALPPPAFPEEVQAPELYTEGAARRISVNAYERDPAARDACVAHHGARCSVCGFAFGELYGEWGEGFIHVHHVVPLAKRGERYEVDPVRDLVPVCANCHAMLHRRAAVLDVELLRAKVAGSTLLNRSSGRHEAAERPRACPACGHEPVAEIRYGMPAPSPDLEKGLENGTIALGGCEITGDDPAWRCAACFTEVYRVGGG